MPDDSSAIEKCARTLHNARALVVSTGAGISRESGIPTFRDAPSALWANYDPQKLATREGFRADPALVWRWYDERRRMISASTPNAGHVAIAELEDQFEKFVLLTQNIDNLHREAGSKNIVEIHGNIFRFKCFDHGHAIDRLPAGDDIPPACHCGSFIRPDVVWFGELLDEENLAKAFSALESSDVVLVVGTSGLVQPAAGFPMVAKSAGAIVIEINPERTPVTDIADIFLEGAAGKLLPQVLSRLTGFGKKNDEN